MASLNSSVESSLDKDLQKLDSADSMARDTVSLPRSLCRQFRLHALDQDTTLSALMARLIRQELGSIG